MQNQNTINQRPGRKPNGTTETDKQTERGQRSPSDPLHAVLAHISLNIVIIALLHAE